MAVSSEHFEAPCDQYSSSSMRLLRLDHPRSEHDPDSSREDSQTATAVEATFSEAAVGAISDLSMAIAHADLEAPPTVTGAADPPSHESSRVQLFRLAFPAHVMLHAPILNLILTLSTFILLVTSNLAPGIRALCMALVAVGCVVLVVGSVSHLAQLVQDEENSKRRLVQEKLRLEERNEQLQAEKERLLYDVQRPGRPLDAEEGRSAIRCGLRAGLAPPSEAGGPAPSDSPPPSLPPGAPSSSATDSGRQEDSESVRAPEEAEGTSWMPSWHPPLRRQRVTALNPPAAAEASSYPSRNFEVGTFPIAGQKRAGFGQVLIDEVLVEMAMEKEEASAAVCTRAPARPPHTLRASRSVCPLTSCTTQIIQEEAVAAQMLQQAITNQINQETAIPIEITPPSPLQQKFDALIMCNFTPRKPSELPVLRWVSCD